MRRSDIIKVMLISTLVIGLGIYLVNCKKNHQAYQKLPFKAVLTMTASYIPITDLPTNVDGSHDTLLSGITVGIQGEYRNWYYVRTKNGKQGWVKKVYMGEPLDTRKLSQLTKDMLQVIEESKSKFQ